MTPSIIWGIGIGLVIAVVDAAAAILGTRFSPTEWPIGDIDLMLNVALYSLIGFQVGKATGLIRDAAEGAVLAGFLVSAIGLAFAWLFQVPNTGIGSTWEVISMVSWNVAMGGVLGIMAGWFGMRAGQSGRSSGRL